MSFELSAEGADFADKISVIDDYLVPFLSV